MQLTRKQLKQIISEEVENIANESDEIETLLENYQEAYSDENSEYISKEALIDFLEIMEEQKIPKSAFEAFIFNLPEEKTLNVLKEVVE